MDSEVAVGAESNRGRELHVLGLQLSSGGLAGVCEQVVLLAEGLQLQNEIPRDLITLRPIHPPIMTVYG